MSIKNDIIQNINSIKSNFILFEIKNKFSIFSFSLLKKYIIFILLLSKISFIYCEENTNNKDSAKKTKILLILLVVIFGIIIIFLPIFLICMCCKKRNERNRNNFIEASNFFERGNPEEVSLREKIINNGIKVLSEYLKEKLVCDIYSKKFELFGNQCSICLEKFEENNSLIIMGGCLHIFHQKCLGELAEKIDLNKSIFSQFICPTCRINLIDNVNKIKNCLERCPNFFDDMYKNKKITKIKHVKNLINLINEKDNSLNDNHKSDFENNKTEKGDNNNEIDEIDRKNIKDENKDFSYDNTLLTKDKFQSNSSRNNIGVNIVVNNNQKI